MAFRAAPTCATMVEMDELQEERDRTNRIELTERLASAIPNDGIVDRSDGLRLARSSQPTDRIFGVSRPSFCLIAQGAKQIYVGGASYRYDGDHYLIATVEMPITGSVVQATREAPYLSIRMDLDPAMVTSVMLESGFAAPSNQAEAKAVYVSPLTASLRDAALRLIRLLDDPAEAKALMALVKREIVYRLLVGEQGARLRHLPLFGGYSNRITKAVERLRKDFDKRLSIENLARDLGMSSSGFHQHFKTVMDMSPLQFQKLLRLQEARRLMLGEDMDAASAGFRVGYDDPSHFSRDYKRHYGASPIRDVERLRSMVASD